MHTPGQAPDHAPSPARRSVLRWHTLLCYLIPLAILGAVTLPHLAQGDWRGDTGWYAALGWSAWDSGKLWTLYAGDNLFYFNKPPLALWIHGLFLHAASVADPAALRANQPLLLAIARLPTILAAGIVVLATVGTARQFLDRSRAMGAGIVLALSMEFFRRCREISLDMWQLAFLACAVWLVAIAARKQRGGWIVAAGIPIGLSLLCKPLMGLLAIPMLAAWLLLIRRSRLAIWLFGTALVALLVAAPWHLSMWSLHGTEFTAQYFGAEVAKRAIGESVGGQRGQPRTFYLMQILAGYWPWLVCAVFGIASLKHARRNSRAFAITTLGLVWFAGWLVLLSIFPDRRDRYAVPLYPGLALVAGPWTIGFLRSRFPRVLEGVRRVGLPIAIAAGVLFALLPVRVQRAPDPQWLEFQKWCTSQSSPELYDGAFAGAPAARVYLLTGRWPIPTADRWGKSLASPPPGSLIAYHRRGGRAPGPNESVRFHAGDITITQLTGTWSPQDAPDPGE